MTRFLRLFIALAGLAGCGHDNDAPVAPDAAEWSPPFGGSAHLPKWECGDGVCEIGETAAACPADCGSAS